jgi:hypothetical protein
VTAFLTAQANSNTTSVVPVGDGPNLGQGVATGLVFNRRQQCQPRRANTAG